MPSGDDEEFLERDVWLFLRELPAVSSAMDAYDDGEDLIRDAGLGLATVMPSGDDGEGLARGVMLGLRELPVVWSGDAYEDRSDRERGAGLGLNADMVSRDDEEVFATGACMVSNTPEITSFSQRLHVF